MPCPARRSVRCLRVCLAIHVQHDLALRLPPLARRAGPAFEEVLAPRLCCLSNCLCDRTIAGEADTEARGRDHAGFRVRGRLLRPRRWLALRDVLSRNRARRTVARLLLAE